MASSLMQHMCYLIMLTVCIDQGDGRWRERDKESLRHDIELYKRMTEKIEHEIEVLFNEYPDERFEGDNGEGTHYEHSKNSLNSNTETTKENKSTDRERHHYSSNTTSVITKAMPIPITVEKYSNKSSYPLSFQNKTESDKEARISGSDWPKFYDILLAIGKKYDWKTDRWIKVKEKLKNSKVKGGNEIMKTKDEKRLISHEKHKFNYRIVKLNRSKSRRNIVVAVSAIR